MPLKLQNYFFSDCHIVYTPATSENDKFSMPANFSVSTKIDEVKNHPGIWNIGVRVETLKTPDDTNRWYNFEFQIEAIGFFENTDESDVTEKIKQMIHANGAAILLGAIRERLASATATSPFGPYYLPALSLRFEKDKINRTKERHFDFARHKNKFYAR